MDLKYFTTTLLCTMLLLCTPAWSDEATPLPNPRQLTADWWVYLAPDTPLEPEVLKERVDALNDSLLNLEKDLRKEERVVLSEELIGTVRKRLATYLEARQAEPLQLGNPALAMDTYTLKNALQRFEVWKQQQREIVAEADEFAWQQDLIAAKRRQLNRQKLRYLEMPAEDIERLNLGLTILRERFEIETSAVNLGRRRTRNELLREQSKVIEEELENIAAKLVSDSKSFEYWSGQQKQAQETAQKLRQEIAEEPDNRSTSSELDDNQRARAEALRVIQLSARASRQELLGLQSGYALSMLALMAGAEPDPQDRAAQDQALDATLKELDQNRKYWTTAIKRARDLSAAINVIEARQEIADAQREQARQLLDLVDSITAELPQLQQQRETTVFFQRLRSDLGALQQGLVRQWLQQAYDFGANSLTIGRGLLTETLFEVNETPVTAMGLLRVIFILGIAWLISFLLRRGLARLAERRSTVSQSSLYTFGRILHYFILGIGIMVGLSSVGIDFTKFALLASALGIGIGFGLQNMVSNFVAGLIILFEQSLKVGDFVELESGVTGEVREINMRSTLVTTNDNVDILVPNSEFVNKQVTNWTLREAHRRIHVPFGVAYGTSKELVKKAALEAAANVKWSLQNHQRRAPQLFFVAFGDSSLNFELVVWLTPEAVKRPGPVLSDFLWEIDTKLAEYGIEIPFPQRDINLRGVLGARDDEAKPTIRELLAD